jgi:hypothetical protein
MTTADKIWNRAAMEAGGNTPGPGDRALASLLLVHGLIMNGGVHHAVEGVTSSELSAATEGYSYFGYGDVAALLNSVHKLDDQSQVTDELEAATDAMYAQLIPDDSHLVARFETAFSQRPDQFAPLA